MKVFSIFLCILFIVIGVVFAHGGHDMGAMAVQDEKVGFKNIEVISKLRNARTGHPLAICANIRAYKI